jgi:hypothetical protein
MQAVGGFADWWLWGEPEYGIKLKPRDFRLDVITRLECPVCGAKRGEFCTRPTLAGRVQRRVSHLGRNKPRRNNYTSRSSE